MVSFPFFSVWHFSLKREQGPEQTTAPQGCLCSLRAAPSFSNSLRSRPNEQCVPGHQPVGRALSMHSVTCWLPTWKTTYLQVMGDSRLLTKDPRSLKNKKSMSSQLKAKALSRLPQKEDSQERPAALESKTGNLISCCSLILISCLKQISTPLREQKIIMCRDEKWD